MGATFFYLFIYFISYYGLNAVNMLTVRPLITNRYIAAMFPVVGVALTHVYMILNSPPPASMEITVESAIFFNVVMPVIFVVIGAAYLMWNSKDPDASQDDNESTGNKEPEETEADSAAVLLKEEIGNGKDSDTDNPAAIHEVRENRDKDIKGD